MSIHPQFGFALEYVPDVEQAKHFYTDVLGLKVERVHPTFVQFDRFAIASEESRVGKGGPEMYWVVGDADAAFAELSRKGEVSMPVKQMPFGKVFAIKDPAGNPCYVIEFAANRASRPVD